MAGFRDGFGVRLLVWQALGAACALSAAMFVMTASAVASPPRYEFVKQFGTDGSETPSFEEPSPVTVDQQTHAVYAASGNPRDQGPAAIYKFDAEGNPVDWAGSAPYLSGNELGGLQFSAERTSWRQIAVDSTTHIIYVNSNNSITAFDSEGEPSEFTAGSGAGTNAIGGFKQLSGLAVDSNGDIYASDAEGGAGEKGEVKVFAPSGELLTQFATAEEEPASLAVDSTGAVYVARTHFFVTKYTPSIYPVTASTSYVAASESVDPEGSSYSVGVDPTTNEVFIPNEGEGETAHVSIYAEDGHRITKFGGQGTPGELNFPGGIAIDGSSKRVYIGNHPAAAQPSLSLVDIFRPEPAAAPKIEVRAVSGISSTSATFYARINPDQMATTYRFEYGLEDCSVSVCTSVPVGGAAIGSGNDGVWVSQKVSTLVPATPYHYRVIAENGLGSEEAAGVFSTQAGNLVFKLSDSRAWEMVSPANKRGARLRGTEPDSGPVQAAADGNGIAYVTVGSLEEAPEGNRALEVSSVLARRGATGWDSKDITPPNGAAAPPPLGEQGEYKLFSTDLSEAVLDPRSETALSPEASERAPYLRENTAPPSYRPLVTGKEGFANVPPGTEFGGGKAFISDVTVQNATPDLRHVVLLSFVPLVAGAPTPAPGTTAPSLYEWTDEQLKPISVLPSAEGGGIVVAQFSGSGDAGSGSTSLRHAISEDGSRVFWTGREAPNNHLYMRDMEAEESIRLDEVQGGSGEGKEDPVFQGASSDGTAAFFTDFQQLTPDSGASFDFNANRGKADLYECEITRSGGSTQCELRDLTPKVGSEGADVQGVVSALSEDGSKVYFVADGALATGQNQFGDTAISGQPNLYLWQRGEGVRFIATLASGDRPDWGLAGSTPPPGRTSELSAMSSPSGRYLGFMSERNLTGQESVEVPSGEAVERVFRYDSVTGRLDCVSCAPDGASPQGALIRNEENPFVDPRSEWGGRQVAATLPQPEILRLRGETAYQPRAVLDNGRVFFNAFDSLVPADSNKQWDVYQYEGLGVGDCGVTSGNADISRSGEGCVSLMSSGTGESEAGFLDASVSGDDVFFLTPARLAATDVDNEVDLYDARVGGTVAVPGSATECDSGESCRPASTPPQEVAPGSSSFSGAGNLKAGKKCPKGKRRVKRGGKERCIARKGKKHHRRAEHGKGAGR